MDINKNFQSYKMPFLKTIIFIFTLFSFCQACKAQVKEYQNIAEGFIEGINHPNQSDAFLFVFSESLKPKADAIYSDFSKRYGTLTFHHADVKPSLSDPDKLLMHIYAKSTRSKMYTDFQLIADAGSYKIEKIVFIAEVAEPISLPNSSIEATYTQKWLDDYIRKLQLDNDLYGSILIAKGDSVIYDQYFGKKNASGSDAINAETVYSISSGGKMFTALAMMQLIEQGKVNISDPITMYLKGFSNTKKAKKIKIHHLLSHTSGFGEYWSGQRISELENVTTLQPIIDYVMKMGFDFEAGKDYQYCNSNYILLGAIIERASGTSFYDFVQKNIFDKAEMKNTSYLLLSDPKVAQHLGRDSLSVTGWKELPHGKRGTSAGGVTSSPHDILLFSRALKDNKLLSKTNFSTMIRPQNKPYGQGEEYGYGFILENRSDELTYGHGGTSSGNNFEYRYFPKQDISVILMNNQNNGAYDDLKRNIIKLVSGER